MSRDRCRMRKTGDRVILCGEKVNGRWFPMIREEPV